MACGGAVGGSSIYKGSEEGFDYECDPCKVDEATKEAKHFCPLCQEYLCDACHAHHRRSKATRAHKIQSVKDMQKSDPVRIMGPHNTCGCGQNIADFYCEAHKEVFCLTCKTVQHRSCNVEVLDAVAKSKGCNPQFKETIDELNELRQQASETESLQDDILESLAANENDCIENINAFREDLNKLLDELERKTVIDVRGRCTRQKDKINDRKEVCRNIRDKLDADYKTATDMCNANDPRDIFIQNFRLSQTLTAYRDAIRDAKSETVWKKISFTKDSYLENVQMHAKTIGHLEENTQHVLNYSFLTANLAKIDEFPFQTRFDGICFINKSGSLIATSSSSKTIIRLNSNFQIVESLKLRKSPGEITEISDTEIICSLSFSKQIQCVEVYPNLKLKNNIKLNKYCFGIKCYENDIFVCCADGFGTEVQVFTKDETLQKVLNVSNSTKPVYTVASGLGLSKDGQRLYISEYERQSLTCMKTNGDIIFTLSYPAITKPRDVTVDDDNNCIVCNQSSGLEVCNSSGSLLRHLCDVTNPYLLAWRKSDNTLVVCNGYKLITYTMKFD